MLKIGITGGIGSGKSTVSQIFEVLGIPVYYADVEAKRLMNEDEELRTGIINSFGELTYPGGRLDRKYLAGVVFNNPEKLELLNSLVHPVTMRDAERWISLQSSPYIIKEAALLFESGANKHLDKIIGVSAPEELRIARTMKRDGVSREDVLARMEKQIDEEEKMRLCDTVIVNDEAMAVIPQVMAVHEEMVAIGALGAT